jgi:MFS transporter, DHA1 family, multidrug resistance protein
VTETLRERWRILIGSRIWSVAALLLVQMLAGAWTLSLMSFFPIYLEEQLRYAPVAIAGMVAIGQASGMAAALLGGGLSDTLGSKWVLVFGLLGGVTASLIFQSGVPLMVAVLWGLVGAANSLQTLGGSSYLTRMADPRRLGLLSALYALSGTLGGALGSPAAGRILDTAGYRTYGLVGLGLAVCTVLLAVILLPNRQTRGHDPVAGSSRDSMWAMTRRPVMRLLMALRFLPTIYYGMSIVLIPLMINHLAGNKTTVALYSTVGLIVASIAQLLTGRAADRFGHRRPTLVGYGALIVAALGLAAFANQLWGVFLFGVMGLAVAWSLAALMFVLVSDGVPSAEHGRAFGLLHATWSLAMITGSLLGGALTRVAPGLPFLTAALLNIGSVAVAMAFFAHLDRVRTAGAGVRAGELDVAT